MRKGFLAFVLAIITIAFISDPAAAQQVNAGISISNGQINDFYMAIGNYFRVPEKNVVVVHERQIPDEELPVVFFIAQKARIKPEAVIDLRLDGKSWWDISVHFKLGPEVYYVPMREDYGPPYGHAYGLYKRPRSEWRSIVLNDDDVVNLVNLRFISERYGCPREDVVKYRSQGRTYMVINDDMRKVKSEHKSKGRGHEENREKSEKSGKHGGERHGKN
jgi:hypothetical protein